MVIMAPFPSQKWPKIPKNQQKLPKIDHISALGEKLLQCHIIEPDAPNISKADPGWMKNGEMVADSA